MDTNRYRAEVKGKEQPDHLPPGRQWPPWWATRVTKDKTLKDLHMFLGVIISLAAGGRSRFPIREMLHEGKYSWATRVPWMRAIGVTESWFLTWVMILHCQPDTWMERHGGGGRRKHGGPTDSGVQAEFRRMIHDTTARGGGGAEEIPHNHRVPKIGRFLEQLRRNCQMSHVPGRDIALDEQTATSDHRMNPARHIMPHKPSNGCKIYALCESDTGYCIDFMVDLKERCMTIEMFVLTLCSRLTQCYHRVWMDNLFTSVTVLLQLRQWKILAAGTARATGGFPRSLNPKFNVLLDKARDRGKWLFQMAQGLIAFLWCDVGMVKFLSNFHMPFATMMIRRMAGKRERIEVEAPFVAEEYNKRMGGVDLCDQLRVMLTTQRKSAKWWHCLFYWALDLALVNAYVCYEASSSVLLI